MKTGGSSFWNSGAVPLIEPEVLSSIIAAAADIALVVDEAATILSVIVSPSAESFGNLSHWEGRPVVDFLAEDSVDKFQSAADAPSKLIELKKVSSYRQASFVEDGGWATLPGNDKAESGVARACAKLLGDM